MVQSSLILFSCSVMSNSLWPHGWGHASFPCLKPTPAAYSKSCPLTWWRHSNISYCHPLLLLTSIFTSIRVFSSDSHWKSAEIPDNLTPMNHISHQVAKALEFQLQQQSFQWIFGLISFRMDWLDLLAVQRTLKSLLQHCSSIASIFWPSAFFIVQLSHPWILEKP